MAARRNHGCNPASALASHPSIYSVRVSVAEIKARVVRSSAFFISHERPLLTALMYDSLVESGCFIRNSRYHCAKLQRETKRDAMPDGKRLLMLLACSFVPEMRGNIGKGS